MNRSSINKITVLLFILLLVAAVSIVGCFSDNKNPRTEQHFASAKLLPVSKPLLEFSLESQRGDRWTAERFRSHWSLVFFGFTSCPDICPMELHELTVLLQLVAQTGRTDVQVIFISLDPERDNREKIARYLAAFSGEIVGLRGTNAELAKISHFFAADYSRHATLSNDTTIAPAGTVLSIPAGIDMPANVDQNYQVEHSSRIYIVGPAVNYIGSFTPPFKAQQLWSELQVIIKR